MEEAESDDSGVLDLSPSQHEPTDGERIRCGAIEQNVRLPERLHHGMQAEELHVPSSSGSTIEPVAPVHESMCFFLWPSGCGTNSTGVAPNSYIFENYVFVQTEATVNQSQVATKLRSFQGKPLPTQHQQEELPSARSGVSGISELARESEKLLEAMESFQASPLVRL